MIVVDALYGVGQLMERLGIIITFLQPSEMVCLLLHDRHFNHIIQSSCIAIDAENFVVWQQQGERKTFK